MRNAECMHFGDLSTSRIILNGMERLFISLISPMDVMLGTWMSRFAQIIHSKNKHGYGLLYYQTFVSDGRSQGQLNKQCSALALAVIPFIHTFELNKKIRANSPVVLQIDMQTAAAWQVPHLWAYVPACSSRIRDISSHLWFCSQQQ